MKDELKGIAKSLKGLGGTPEGWDCCFLFIADIARQLTIANEIATRRHQVEYASAQQKNPDITYEVDPPIGLSAKPSPDVAATEGLVEVIEKVRDHIGCGIHDEDGNLKRECTIAMTELDNCFEWLDEALAAHEKAVP